MRLPIQIAHRGYGTNSDDAAFSPPAGKQLRVFNFKAHNRSGGAVDIGLLKRLSTDGLAVSTITAASTPDASEVTDTILAGSAVNLFQNGVNNAGYLIQHTQRFNLIGFNVSQAETGTPVYTYEYWNGSAWATLPTIAVPASYGTGSKLVVFLAPLDWEAGTDATVGGDSDKFSILVRATTAPTANVQADEVWAAQLLDFAEGVADNGSLELEFPSDLPLILEGEEGLQPYFGGTASSANCCRMIYSVQD